MKIFLDTCVLCDMILDRQNRNDTYNALMILRLANNSKFQFCISPISVATAYYLLRKQTDAAATVKNCVKDIDVVPSTENDVIFSYSFDYRDREDAMQMSSALNSDCELILTRDISHFVNAPLPCMTPGDFISKIRK